MANPTLIAFSEHDSVQASAASEASTTLTWQTGDVLICPVGGEGANNGVTASIANTGSGLPTWTVSQTHASNNDTTTYLFTTTATGNGSGIVTATISTANAMVMGVYQFRAPAGATIALGNTNIATGKTTTTHVVALTISSPDSSVVWAAFDWGAGAVETLSPTPTTHTAGSPGPSASPNNTNEGTHYTFYIDELDDQVATGSVNFGTTGATGGPFAIVAAEITISGGAAPSPAPQRMPLSL